MLSLLDGSKDEATSATPKDETCMENKRDGRCLVVYTSINMKVEEKFYFDSGSSRHMTGNREFLTNLQPCSFELVTFGDGGKGKVLGSGSLKILGMPKLENVLLVDGLKVNLISISQLCDDNLFVQFTKGSCLVTNNLNSCVMEGKRSLDNCYLLTFSRTCCATLMNNSDIWHKRLGRISPRSLNETIAADTVLGIPKMKADLGKMCGSCQIGKQVWMPHKVTQHMTITRTLKLLQMDLMGPMQVESLRGIRCAFLCVDNFSRYSCITSSRKNQTPLMCLKHCLMLEKYLHH